MNKSCETCPSLLTPEQARDRFKRPTGAPMCGRFGYILGYDGQPVADNRELLKSFAENCDHHGQPDPGKAVTLDPRVAEPSSDIIGDGPTGATVQSCNACRNCVKHTTVMNEWGWPLPLCKAKGRLIFEPMIEAKGDARRGIDPCPWANPGMPSESLVEVELRKEFRPGFVMNAEMSFQAMLNNGNLNLEPSTYVTDDEVTEEELEAGIRAWRKLQCPWGTGKETFLPIFDPAYFTDEERERIPATGDAHNPELYVDYSDLLWRFAVTTWERDKTLLIQSLPGLGKTEFTYWLAWLMQVPWTRVFFTDSIEWDDIFGKMLFVEGETRWQDGRFTEAFTRPGVICVDEPNLARSEITATLRTSTEKVGTLYLDASVKGEKQKIVRQKHKYCWPVWCANPAWDHRNIGTKELAAADISRLAPAVLETPPPAVERQIIKGTIAKIEGFDIPDDLLTDLMKVSEDLRQMSHDQEFPGTWGIRENLDVAGNLAWYPFEEAFRMSALNYFNPEIVETIVKTSIKTIRVDGA